MLACRYWNFDKEFSDETVEEVGSANLVIPELISHLMLGMQGCETHLMQYGYTNCVCPKPNATMGFGKEEFYIRKVLKWSRLFGVFSKSHVFRRMKTKAKIKLM